MRKKSLYLARLVFSIAIMVVMLASTPGKPNLDPPTRIYVDADITTGDFDGTSWENAYVYLQEAIDLANNFSSTEYEIWVAEGVYYPDEGSNFYGGHTDNNPGESFSIRSNNVKLYGGFTGGETSLAERDWEANPTILSGDIDGNDTNSDGNHIAESTADLIGTNANHVITISVSTGMDITSAVIVDGFIITAGSATAGGTADFGGGIFCNGTDDICSPTLRDLLIQGNLASLGGGIALYAANSGGRSSPSISNVSFINNEATNSGGAFFANASNHTDAESLPVMVNVIIKGNSAGSVGSGVGGGMHLRSIQGTVGGSFSNIEVYNNTAHSGAGMYNSANDGDFNAALHNVTFSGNTADGGGAIYNTFAPSGGNTFSVEINNSILWGNVGTTQDPEIFNYTVVPVITNSDIAGSFAGPGGTWVSSFGTDNGGNLDEDPLFVNPGSGDLRVLGSSPVINAGDQTLLPADVTDLDQDANISEDLPLDLAGNPRVTGSDVDMGAYEYIPGEEDNPGFYIPSKYRWYFKTNRIEGWSGVISMGWGGASELEPVTGDWDGDGVDTAGFYKPSQYKWYLKNNQTNGWAGVTSVNWGGSANLTPIAGDWDGDGDDTIGFYNPATSEWFLKDENTAGWSGFTKVIWGGAPGNLPIVGDWDGDGDDTIGYFVPSQNKWWLKNDLADGWGGVTGFNFGTADPMDPVTGDWDGDGVDTVGGYTSAKWRWYLKDDQVSGWSNVSILKFGPTAHYEVLAGDWE